MMLYSFRWFFYVLLLFVFMRLGVIFNWIYDVATYLSFTCANDYITYLYAKNITLAHSYGIEKCIISEFKRFGIITLFLMIASVIHYYFLLGKKRLSLLFLFCMIEGIMILGFSMYVVRFRGGKCDKEFYNHKYKTYPGPEEPDSDYKRFIY